MSFIFLWKPSVIPLLLLKRHMQTMASSQLARVLASEVGSETEPAAKRF